VISVCLDKKKSIFLTPTGKEMEFVRKIFEVPHFRSMISKQSILKGPPVAGPFVIAATHIRRNNTCAK